MLIFPQEDPHPFATAMTEFLLESGVRAIRPAVVNAMMRKTKAKYNENQRVLLDLVDESKSSVYHPFTTAQLTTVS